MSTYEMSLYLKREIEKTIGCLGSFIHHKKYRTDHDVILTFITPGEEYVIETTEEAEKCRAHLESILEFEKIYSKS